MTKYIQTKLPELMHGIKAPAGYSTPREILFHISNKKDIEREIQSQLNETFQREVNEEEVQKIIWQVVKYTDLQKKVPPLMISSTLKDLG